MLIDLTSDDIVIVRRLAEDALTQKVLVARLSYQAKVPPKDFEVRLDGQMTGADITFNFEGDRGALNGDFRTRDIMVSEWSRPNAFFDCLTE